jgi:hypothetical protein
MENPNQYIAKTPFVKSRGPLPPQGSEEHGGWLSPRLLGHPQKALHPS